MSIPFKVGILRLGRVAGKSKYALIDEADIPIVQQYAVEARVEVDKNGQGAAVYAFAFDCTRGRKNSQKLHEMLWEVRRGGTAFGWKVVHKNRVTMDNRQENLLLVREGDTPTPVLSTSSSSSSSTTTVDSSSSHHHHHHHPSHPSSPGVVPPEAWATKNMENSIYWMTVLQIVNDPNEHRFPEHVCARYYDSDGRVFESGTGGINGVFYYDSNGINGVFYCDSDGRVFESGTEELYYECHYPPCSRMESELREFHICGRCQYVRYCGQQCQERDWPMHRHYCREKHPPSSLLATVSSSTASSSSTSSPLYREHSPDR
ncbi:hypothetical protein ACOMHN_001544 [Nucella lapillus]